MPGWVELHCHSNSSFLDGASDVGDLVDAAADAGMDVLALTDTNGLYGAVRFANAARERGLKPLYGAELHLLDAGHLVVIARDRQGWTSLCRIISAAQLAGEKTKPRATFALVRENAAGLFALTGCAHGAVPRAVRSGDLDAAGLGLRRALLRRALRSPRSRRSRGLRHARLARRGAGARVRRHEQRPLRAPGGAAAP